jgi:hypothetical protein
VPLVRGGQPLPVDDAVDHVTCPECIAALVAAAFTDDPMEWFMQQQRYVQLAGRGRRR